jgi:hypothetical protein
MLISMKFSSPRRSLLASFALVCVPSLVASAGLQAQSPRRLYGILDAEYFGNVAFSVDLGGDHDVAYYAWARDLNEVEGMAIDGEGELYLFSESGVVKKADLGQPNRPAVQVATSRFDFTSVTVGAGGVMELYDARGRQFVTFDPRTDRFSTEMRPAGGQSFDGLARTSAGLYGLGRVGRGMGLFSCTGAGCARTCASASLPADLQSIEAYAGSTLVFAWTSITPTNQIVLYVDTMDPATCARTRLLSTQLDRDALARLLRRQVNLDRVLGQARGAGRSVEIEALAVQR